MMENGGILLNFTNFIIVFGRICNIYATAIFFQSYQGDNPALGIISLTKNYDMSISFCIRTSSAVTRLVYRNITFDVERIPLLYTSTMYAPLA